MNKELLKGLTDEQIAKIKECKNNEEIFALAKQEGVELTDEQLEAVSGGNCIMDFDCPKCGGNIDYNSSDEYWNYTCPHCGYKFKKPQSTM